MERPPVVIVDCDAVQMSSIFEINAHSSTISKLNEVEREASTLLEAARMLLPFLKRILSLFFSVH